MLIGFKAGIGLVIVLDQLPKLLGVHIQKGNFLHNLSATVAAIPETSVPTLAVGVLTILLLIGIEHWFPRAPAPLIAVAVGIAAMSLLGLEARGVETVGEIPRGLPSFVPPDLALVGVLWPGALGIALMSFTETIAAARAFAAPGRSAAPAQPGAAGDGARQRRSGRSGVACPAAAAPLRPRSTALAGARTQLAGW